MFESSLAWSHYAGDQSSSRYSSSSGITRENFTSLEIGWRHTSPDETVTGYRSSSLWPGKHESTPIMVGNILYSSSSLSQAYALNPKTGEVLWTYNPESYAAGSPPNLGYINRGVAYWQDGDVRRVFLATGDSRLIALDADTGNPVTSWAQQGEVNLRDGLGRSVSNRYYGVNSPPLVCGDFVIVGSSILDYPAADAMPPGDVRAFDARTGELQWQFHSIPHEDEKGAETWEQRSNERFGGVNVWTSMSCDEALRVVYLPFSTPTNDYYGGGRPGDNLYAESLVAVDMATGELRWHYQCVHHGIWDYDLPAAPNLVDTPSGSRLVAQVSKQGFVYVFDRETGTPVWPMNETAVEASGVPGEVSAMTQPIPTKPAPFELQGVTLADLNSLTPGLEQAARDAVQGYDLGPIFSPPTERGRLAAPGIGGGASWSGAAYQPERGYLYVPSVTLPFILAVQPASITEGWVGAPRVAPFLSRGLPLVKPPYGRITAIDMTTGEHVWMSAVGEGYENSAALSGVDVPPLGLPSRIFVLATPNLLIAAQEGGGGVRNPSPERNADQYQINIRNPSLRAYDLDNGELIGQVALPSNAMGTPMLYEIESQPFVIVPIGGANLTAELVALTIK